MEEKARCVIAEFLGKRKVELEELKARRKGDPLKIELAAELRKQTAMSMGWIAPMERITLSAFHLRRTLGYRKQVVIGHRGRSSKKILYPNAPGQQVPGP
jgi:hypothetical protein